MDPIIQEFIENYGFGKVAQIKQCKYRFRSLREAIKVHSFWDLIWFRDVERLDLQIKFAESMTCLIFCDFPDTFPPIPSRFRAFRIKSIDRDLLMLTDDTAYIDYAHKFMTVELHDVQSY